LIFEFWFFGIATPSARNDNGKGAMTPPCRREARSPLSLREALATKQSHALQGNPELKALNPEQILISKFKTFLDIWILVI